MNAELASSLQELLAYMLLLSAQLAVIMALRVPVARYLGATTAYRLWALPLLWLPCMLLELPAPDWSWLSALLQAGSDSQGSVSWVPLALQEFELQVTLLPFELLRRNGNGSGLAWSAMLVFWLAVATVLPFLQLLRILRFNRALRTEAMPGALPQSELQQLPAGLQVCFVQGLTSPALFGIIRPQLLLPADFLQRFDARMRTLIIRHELVHYQRRDNLWNLVAMLLRTLFWFNPLLHLAWHCFRLDQELACDERVLRGTHPDEGKQYARTLLESMSGITQGSQPATITAWGNLRELRERTQMIKHRFTHKPHYSAGKYLLALCLLAGGIATTSFDSALPQALAAEEAPMQSGMRQDFADGIQRVMQLRDEGNLAAASTLLDTLEQNDMNTREQYGLLLLRANLAQAQEQYAQAIDWYEAILQLDEITDLARQMSLMQLGNLHYVLEDFATAIDYWLRFLDSSEDPQPEAVARLSYAYYQLGDYEAGIPYAEQAIALGRTDRNTYALLRAYYLSTDNNDDGRRINNTMIELFDNDDDRKLEEQFKERLDGTSPATSKERIDNISPTMGQTNPEILPIRTTRPKYPARALNEGIEGHVVVQFTIDEQGAVSDAVVVEADPADTFDAVSLDAIQQFQFPVRQENGQAVRTEGVRYVFRYNLSD